MTARRSITILMYLSSSYSSDDWSLGMRMSGKDWLNRHASMSVTAEFCIAFWESATQTISYPTLYWVKVGKVLWSRISAPYCQAMLKPFYYRTAAGAEIDLVIRLASNEILAVEIKFGVAPKISKHFNRTCEEIGATGKYVVYGGDDEIPIGNDLTVISLPRLMRKLQD